MSDKEIETVSKPKMKVEEVEDSKDAAERPNKQDGQDSQGDKNDVPEKKSVRIADPEETDPDAKTQALEPPVSVGTSKRDEKEDNGDVRDDDEEKPPPLPARRGPVETAGEGSGTTFPRRPENPLLKHLKEAFPTIEEKYVKSIIIASQGALEPAFHALLFLSDPESGRDIELPSEPLSTLPSEEPSQRGRQSQVEQDEMLARKLDEKYNSNRRRIRHPNRREGYHDDSEGYPDDREEYGAKHRFRERRRRRPAPMGPEEYDDIYGDDDSDGWGQFVEKDLPELRIRANKSLEDTAAKLNGWWNGLAKKWYTSDEESKENNHKLGSDLRDVPPKKPERRRFNSFGARVDDDSTLESHGITLQHDEEDLEVPPQLKSKTQADGDEPVAQTAYIDTPEHPQRKKWQPVPPAPTSVSPTRHSRSSKSPEDDDFLLNSEDEL